MEREEADRENRLHDLRKAANNALLMLWARYSMVVVIPLISALGSVCIWIGSEIWASIKENNRQVQNSMLGMTNEINSLRLAMSTAAGVQLLLTSRVDTEGHRIDQHDREINQIKERYFYAPPR